MRTKLTALITACVALAGSAAAAVAVGPPIPVAQYTFQTMDDVNAFQKLTGTSCKRKWVNNQAMAIGVGDKTNACVFRSSVVGDSSNTRPNQGMSAQASVTAPTPKLQKKAYASVGVRHNDAAGYELRILPTAHKWQYFRDPMGAGEAKLVTSGTYKSVKAGTKGVKPDTFSIQAFNVDATTTSVVAVVNGQSVVNTSDPGTDQPDGRETTIGTGVKGTGAGTGVRSTFDNVTVTVPSPF
jgi:hypothetical protein